MKLHHDTGEPTNRQWEVAQLICEGLSNKEIAARLGVAVKTAVNHRNLLYRKLGCHCAASLCRTMFAEGRLRGQAFIGPRRMQLTAIVKHCEKCLAEARRELALLKP